MILDDLEFREGWARLHVLRLRDHLLRAQAPHGLGAHRPDGLAHGSGWLVRKAAPAINGWRRAVKAEALYCVRG